MVAREAAAAAVIVRAWTPADRAAVRALHVELQDHERAFRPSRAAGARVHEASLAGYEEQLADPETDAALLVAERAGRVVGYVFCCAEEDMLEQPPGEVYVQDLMVTAEARRSGVGKALMAAVLRFADERGITRVTLSVLEGNHDGRAAYRALGFRRAALRLELDVRSQGGGRRA